MDKFSGVVAIENIFDLFMKCRKIEQKKKKTIWILLHRLISVFSDKYKIHIDCFPDAAVVAVKFRSK